METLVIFGSRTLSDHRCEKIIQDYIDSKQLDCIITSGETTGICELARIKARENKIPLKLYFADVKKYAAGCYEHRAKSILCESNNLLIIHDGKSKGTFNELKLAKKLNKNIIYHIVDLLDENEFNLNVNWDGI